MMHDRHRHFRRIALITLAAVYILIAVGSTVRATGAGMGCPDWPTCFGQIIPPTDVSQLPENYQEIYRDRGYADVEFNATKTWTEFFNRLVGVTIGLLSIWTLWAAWRIRKDEPPVFWYALSAFVLVGFNGWLGKVVVSSNLHPAMITTHMVASLLVVASLVLAINHSLRDTLRMSLDGALSTRTWLIVGMVLTIVQIALGVQVRERIDILSLQYDYAERDTWVAQVGAPLTVHILGAMVVVGYNLWLGWRVLRRNDHPPIQRLAVAMMAGVLTELVIGLSLALLGFPAFLQPLHLTLAAIVFGLQMALFGAAQYALSSRVGGQEERIRAGV
ncbi:MAG: COX15/CtaA family protein [Halothiobacillaceae bacterium]